MTRSKIALTRERILSTAARYIERDGIDTLTMRALARDLEVGAMTLYGYIRTKEELLDGVADLALSQLDLSTDESAPWEEQITTIFTKILLGLEDRPGIRELLVLRSAHGPTINLIREKVIRILRTAGYTPAQSVHALAMLYSFTLGFAAASHRSGATDNDFAEVNVRTHPYLAEALLAYPERTTMQTFASGFRFLLEGIANHPA
ncbi:TetR/AcrR family transcriptional regulator [Nocardia sp. NPDC059246]|uniref:TetR/AcrR family transcriptional regulator n=1 Tax=unclassified Nocardia TaxID=2637762 RepID=UPI0036977F3A